MRTVRQVCRPLEDYILVLYDTTTLSNSLLTTLATYRGRIRCPSTLILRVASERALPRK